MGYAITAVSGPDLSSGNEAGSGVARCAVADERTVQTKDVPILILYG